MNSSSSTGRSYKEYKESRERDSAPSSREESRSRDYDRRDYHRRDSRDDRSSERREYDHRNYNRDDYRSNRPDRYEADEDSASSSKRLKAEE